ncbi:MAG TPA: hypothetical protein VHL81_10070 [Gemmatimonadales bacterium]|jgi:hypothetical protein|nr:hypothetical protein [Gemmatimonadales bacterium]
MHLVSRGFAGAVALAFVAGAAHAQAGLTSSPATVSLTATKASTLTVSPASGTATLASITDNSTANVFGPVTLTTAWNLTAGTSVNLVGWFATPAQALANGADFIPSSKVEGRLGAAAFAPFNSGATGGVGVANGSLLLFSQAVGAGTFLGNRSDQLDVRLNLTGTTTVAGNYTGTLNLQAVVQ